MKKRHRIRLTNSLLAAAGGAVLCLIILYARQIDHLILSGAQLTIVFGVFWSINIWFIWAVGSGYSDRFTDGSLTLPQMYWASMSCIASMIIVQGHYEFILLLLFLIMVFGIFRMNGRDFIVYSLVISVTFAVQQTTSFLLQHEDLSSADRVLMWFVFSMCVAMLTSLCNSVAIMRTRLHNKNEELQEALGTKNLFLANMSHEIRTPINGVIGMLRLLQRSHLDENQRHQACLALSSAQNLLGIVNDILDFSKIEAGKMELDNIEFDLRDQLSDIATTMGLRAQEKDLEFILGAENIRFSLVRGDPGRLHQILMNLLGNAVKFTQHGEISLYCKLIEDDDTQVTLECSVKDTGIGIAKENMDNIFSSFTQVDTSTTRSFGGAGLGLSLVKQICALMGGAIKINSAVGYGSEFIFTVKLNLSENARELSSPLSLADKRILVVDSNLSANNALANQLKAWGATVRQAYDHNSAVSLIYDSLGCGKTQLYSTIFIDKNIESDEGVKLSITIRQDSEFDSINIVLLTPIGADVATDPKVREHQRFDIQLFKPVTTDNLTHVLQSVYMPQFQTTFIQQRQSALAGGEGNEGSDLSEPLEQHKILLVEDNEVNRRVAEGLLEQFGLTCEVAENGYEALEKLKTSRKEDHLYQLILMDCQMPVMDGYETTRQIRSGVCGQDYRYIPIVAVTANVMAGDKEKCLNTGMNDYLPKPLDINEVAQKLTQWLGNVKLKSNVVEFNKNVRGNRTALWDESAALRRVGGKKERLSYLVKLFLKSIPQELGNLQNAFIHQDMEGIRKCAHSIKGVAGNMGALKLMDAALNCEKLSKEGKIEPLKGEIANLAICFERTLRVLESYLDQTDTQ